ncbi:MAG: trehalose-phosphatase [Actinomycetota bacterium]
MHVAPIVSSFGQSSRPAVIVDFDGTLSEIVTDPSQATPVAGAVDALSALARSGCRTVVLSGRPAGFLVAALAGVEPEVRLVGHSGLESVMAGQVVVDDAVADWLPVVRDAVAELGRRVPEGVDLEDKGLSLALHFRRSPELAPAVTEVAAQWAAETGLSMKPGRMNVELRPPVAVDKGTAVRRFLDDDIDWVLFAGDDLVDLPAFDAVRQAAGVGYCVAVGSDELPAALAEAADGEVPSPTALVALLQALGAQRAGPTPTPPRERRHLSVNRSSPSHYDVDTSMTVDE